MARPTAATRQDAAYEAMIEVARKEWALAENFFNEVTDPDMTEFAVLQLSTAMKKYEYLFRKIKCGREL